MKVQHLDFGGEKLPLYYGIDAIESIMKGKTMEDLVKDLVASMKKVLFVGLQHGHKKEGLSFKMNMDKLSELIDENPSSFRKAWQMFNDQAVEFFQMLGDEEEKK